MFGTFYDYVKVVRWVIKNKPEFAKFLYDRNVDKIAIADFPKYADIWLWNNCNNHAIRKYLKKRYSEETLEDFGLRVEIEPSLQSLNCKEILDSSVEL